MNKQRNSHPHRKHHGGTLIGLFFGLVLGLVCAFGVAWYLKKAPLPFEDKSGRIERTAPSAPPGTEPPALPGKPGDKSISPATEKQRFEFYKILPGGQVTPTEPGELPATPPPAEGAEAIPATPAPVAVDVLYLQAGAFQKSADADNLKAKLALMGLETSVLEANVPDKGIVYRVRVGPYAKPEEMNRVRNQLSQNGIQATLVKTKEVPAATPQPGTTQAAAVSPTPSNSRR